MDTLDINECAEFLKIERSHALKLAGEGILPGAKIGRAWVFLKDDLVEYLRAQVRLQMRQRAQEQEVQEGLDKSLRVAVAAGTTRSPLAQARAEKKRRNRVDLDKYADVIGSPELLRQLTPAQV